MVAFELSLGVEGLWLTPLFKSSSYHKYNVTDYYHVDPAFGTEDDLKELIALCHERDVLLILDLPINHTARACEWFNKFIIAHRQGDTASEYYNFYTDKKWGAAESYDLCLNSSVLDDEATAGIITEFVRCVMAGSRSKD